MQDDNLKKDKRPEANLFHRSAYGRSAAACRQVAAEESEMFVFIASLSKQHPSAERPGALNYAQEIEPTD